MNNQKLRRRAVLGGAAVAVVSPAFAAAATEALRIAVLTDENSPHTDSSDAGNITAARMAAQDFCDVVLGRRIDILHANTQNKPDVASSIASAWYDVGVDNPNYG